MAKVAIPIEKDCLSTHFATCSHYVVFTITNAKIIDKIVVKPDFSELEQFPDWFKMMAVTDVITYKINPLIINSFIRNKINVFVGTSQVTPEILIQDYINGKLKSNEDILIK